LQLFAVWQRDWAKVQSQGWLHGFCPVTWMVVCMFAFGGLLVAVVIRFADNNLKNLAMAIAIILSCLVSIPLFAFKPNTVFWGGAALVISSIFLYAWTPKPAAGELPHARYSH
jgi:UDP-sugar transporter A1/2/3